MALVADERALKALMNILGDTSFSIYDASYCRQVLLENRQSYIFRNPAFSSSGINPWLFYRGQVHVAPTNPDYTLLEAETDGFNYIAHKFVRHWDAGSPPQIWRNGVLKTITTDYTVDYQNGRVTFLTTVSDWETVNASFIAYRIYHAAQSVLVAALSGSNGAVMVKQDNIEYDYGDIKSRLEAIQTMVANNCPANIRIDRKMY